MTLNFFRSLLQPKNKLSLLPCALIIMASASAEVPYAIVGGEDNGGLPYVALISSAGVASPLTGDIPVGAQYIYSVDMNSSGHAIIGGSSNGNMAYCALVSPTGVASLLTGADAPSGGGEIYALAINNSGYSLIGGNEGGNLLLYAARVSPTGDTTLLTGFLPSGNGYLNAVDINSSGAGIIGGQHMAFVIPYAATVSADGVASPLSGATPNGNGYIISVSMNDSGNAIIGGRENGNRPYAALVSPTGVATSLTGDAPIGNGGMGFINDVAINPCGSAILGGSYNGTEIYCAVVNPNGVATLITGDFPTAVTGSIRAVDINSSGEAIVGGTYDIGYPYWAFVSPEGVARAITGDYPTAPGSDANAVAISPSGAGLIGGSDAATSDAFVALVTPAGVAMRLTGFVPTGNGTIYSLALSLSQIPTAALTGNNLIFANYINEFSPSNAFYFLPSGCNGTMTDALERAAPTRNALSLHTSTYNMFYLTTSLETHIRDRRMIQRRRSASDNTLAMNTNDWQSENRLMASNSLTDEQTSSTLAPVCKDSRPYTVWFDAIGALAYQKEQHQTPAFNPTTGGGILGFDAAICQNTLIGVGVSYLYTHIHEKKGFGHSNINQEDLYLFASWDNSQFYADASLWGGLFQISQVREIDLTGFNFTASSTPNGGHLVPHLEIGYNSDWPKCTPCARFLVNPFLMGDWANAWQGSYTEKGDGPFNASQDSHYASLLRTEAGLRFYETIYLSCWDLIFLQKGSYVNTQSFGTGTVNAFLVGSGGSFTVETLTSPQNLGVAQVAMIFAPHHSNFPTTTLFYQGEFGGGYQSHHLNLEMAWDF